MMSISTNGTTNGVHINMKQQKRPRKLKITVIATILLSMYIIFIYLILITFDSGTATNDNNQDGDAIDKSGYRPPITSHLLRANKSSQQTATSEAQTDQSKARELTLSDFCGLCHWRSQGFNCNERVDWVVKTKHQTLNEAKEANLKYCYNANSCNDKLNDEGFMECDEELANSPNGIPKDYKVGTMKHVEKAPELEAILSGEQFLISTSKVKDINSNEGMTSIVRHKENEEGLRDRRMGEDIVTSVLTAAKYGDRQYDDADEGEVHIQSNTESNNDEGRKGNMFLPGKVKSLHFVHTFFLNNVSAPGMKKQFLVKNDILRFLEPVDAEE